LSEDRLNDLDPVEFLRALVRIFRRVSELHGDPISHVFDVAADGLEARAEQLDAILRKDPGEPSVPTRAGISEDLASHPDNGRGRT
jgi:hypothetical protein